MMRTLAEIKKDLSQIEKDLEEAEDRNWEEFAKEVVDKLFVEFPDGAKWLNDALFLVKKYGHVMSPIGRARRLWRVYTGKRGVIAAAGRRAQNAPIQGFASEMGCTAGTLIQLKCYETIKERGLDMDTHMPKYCRAVHDANYHVVPFDFVIPFIHIQQYMATNGTAEWYKEIFGIDFTIEPEIEVEVGATESKDHCFKWDWEIPNLLVIIYKSLQGLVDVGRLKEKEIAGVFERIVAPWKDKDYRNFLQENFPLLNVKDLDSQIEGALRTFKPPARKSA